MVAKHAIPCDLKTVLGVNILKVNFELIIGNVFDTIVIEVVYRSWFDRAALSHPSDATPSPQVQLTTGIDHKFCIQGLCSLGKGWYNSFLIPAVYLIDTRRTPISYADEGGLRVPTGEEEASQQEAHARSSNAHFLWILPAMLR